MVKTHPLIIVALFMSSISMAIYAFRNYAEHEIWNAVVFIVLSVFFLGVVIWALVRNRRIELKMRKQIKE